MGAWLAEMVSRCWEAEAWLSEPQAAEWLCCLGHLQRVETPRGARQERCASLRVLREIAELEAFASRAAWLWEPLVGLLLQVHPQQIAAWRAAWCVVEILTALWDETV